MAQATHYHDGLAQVLCMAFKRVYPGHACTTIVMRQGRLPQWPRAAAECIACLRARVNAPKPDCEWVNGYAEPHDVDSTDVVAGFFRIPVEGARALQDSAGLARRGFPLYAASQASQRAGAPAAGSAEVLAGENKKTVSVNEIGFARHWPRRQRGGSGPRHRRSTTRGLPWAASVEALAPPCHRARWRPWNPRNKCTGPLPPMRGLVVPRGS